jgi:hypothetical protein
VSWIRAEWDRVGAVVAVIAGAIALLVGYIRTSNTPFLAEQMPLVISGALGGIFLLSVGAILWLSADMRDEWRELRSMSVSLETLTATLTADGVLPASGENGSAPSDSDYARSPAAHAERSHA